VHIRIGARIHFWLNLREPIDNAPAAQTEAATYDPRKSRGLGVGVEPKGREDAQPLTAAAATAAVASSQRMPFMSSLLAFSRRAYVRETDKRFRFQLRVGATRARELVLLWLKAKSVFKKYRSVSLYEAAMKPC